MAKEIFLIGVGPEGRESLHGKTLELIQGCHLIIGGKRVITQFEDLGIPTYAMSSNLRQLVEVIDSAEAAVTEGRDVREVFARRAAEGGRDTDDDADLSDDDGDDPEAGADEDQIRRRSRRPAAGAGAGGGTARAGAAARARATATPPRPPPARRRGPARTPPRRPMLPRRPTPRRSPRPRC
jgi:hypothetical protein